MDQLSKYLGRMTENDVWPAGHDPAEVAAGIGDVTDPAALVLTWKSNGRSPMDDMLAAWVVLGIITREQARATSEARQTETAAFLADYRANPPQPDAEQLAEMRAAFGPGAEVVNVITGQRYHV